METEAKTIADYSARQAAVTVYEHDRLPKQPSPAKPRAAGRSMRMALRMMDSLPSAAPMKITPEPASAERIARRAWEIWRAEGRPDGQALNHWLQAERELKG